MSKYWVYLDDQVAGPYTVDQLIRLRGFSRQTRICMEDGSHSPQTWISPADIPELSHIFKAVFDVQTAPNPPPRPTPKAIPPKPKPFRRPRETVQTPDAVVRPSGFRPGPWISLVLVLAAGVGGYQFWKMSQNAALQKEKIAAQQLVEDLKLPSGSTYPTFGDYLIQKDIRPRWDVEPQPTGLFHVSASWFERADGTSPTSTVYAFESNIHARTVRPLNSKAARLISDGIGGAVKPAPAATAPAPAKPKTPDFSGAIGEWKNAYQSGDFDTVWNSFSVRKVNEMRKGGITREGFIRLQKLTHKLETGLNISIEKTKPEGDESRLVLLRQTQNGRPNVLIKQLWVLEEGAWKLDDEQKKSSEPDSTPPVTSLPGVSN